MKAKNVLPIFALLFLAIPANAQKSYQTNFPLNENPISENGNWISGHAAGNGCFTSPNFCWGGVQTKPGLAFGTVENNYCTGQVGQNCDDSTAVLSGTWGPVQTAEGTVYTNGTLNGGFDEVELRLLTTISTNSITGYEITCGVSGNNYIGMARWNGPLGQFTSMGVNWNAGCTNGDDIKATVDGSGNFTIYKNGTVVFTAHDTTFTSGSPGIGFYTYSGNLTDFGLRSFSASATTGSFGPPPPPPPSTTLEITSSDNSTLTRIVDFLKRLGCQGSRDIWTCK
jgi:hypothetical protein